MSLKLHPKYGVNPTMPICAWCAKPTGDIALLGASYEGEAPRHMIVNHQPCDECCKAMAFGITIVEATHSATHPHQIEFPKGVFMTGRWAVITEDAQMLKALPPKLREQVSRTRRIYMLPEQWARLMPPDPSEQQEAKPL